MRLGGRMAAAMEVLADIETRRRPIAEALKDWGLSHRFAGSGDRSAIGNIVYDAMRRKRSLAWRFGEDGPRALVYAALIAGGHSPEALARTLAGDRFAPEPLSEEEAGRFSSRDLSSAPAAVRADVPDWLVGELQGSFGEDWVSEAEAMAERPPLDLRVNTLKADRDRIAKALEEFSAAPTSLAPHGLRIPPIAGEGRHPNVQVEEGFQKGWFEIQDEGSQLTAALVGAQPSEQLLDICAGAGGKTLALAAGMENSGQVHAYDSDRQRLAPIYDRLARAGARNVQVHAPRDSLADLEDRMDRVVVDAPCTGSGTWRRRPDAKWRLSETSLAARQAEQVSILRSAAGYVRPGGILAYITCSLLQGENGGQIAAFLADKPDFVPLDVTRLWEAALPSAPHAFRAEPIGEGSVLTLTPRLSGTDGFFFGAMQRR